MALDNFAFRRGRSYGTIIVDHDSGRPIELLRDRGRDQIVTYLEQHPEVVLVTRDRDPRTARSACATRPRCRTGANKP